jgi:ATP synthase F1 subcomplex beta subunit
MSTQVLTAPGKVVQVIGPVIDVEFESGQLPEIYHSLEIVAKIQLDRTLKSFVKCNKCWEIIACAQLP